MAFFRKLYRCHQLADRSFIIHGMQMPICARCFGITLGILVLGPLLSVFTFGNMWVSLSLLFLMILDGFLQLKNILKSDNFRRLVTGLGFGYGLFTIPVHVVVESVFLASGNRLVPLLFVLMNKA